MFPVAARIRAAFHCLAPFSSGLPFTGLSFTIRSVKIVCAASVLFGREAFETLGDTVVIPDRNINAANVRDADVLIVRSKTRIDAGLLGNSRISFVGTATAGYDHMDIDWLNEAPIACCAAPGCNANSVAEYITAALCMLTHCKGLDLEKLTLGVIGVGQVGRRVVKKAEALGMRVLQNDPPLALKTNDPIYLPLDDVVKRSDVISLHVPLTYGGAFPTHHMCNCHFFEHIKPGGIFINAARGEAVDTESLLFALDSNAVNHAILDVWENEPRIDEELLKKTDIGTPHIAGYSFEGRLDGTLAVYNDVCHFYEVEPKWKPDESAFPMPTVIAYDAREKAYETALCEIIASAYDIRKDDRNLRETIGMTPEKRGAHFTWLRRSYGARREFSSVTLKLMNAGERLVNKVRNLGFNVRTG